jgi:SAM-dependent methyltransferase
MTTIQNTQPLDYLDMQAHVGITKHNGGLEATDELLSLCHIGAAREVLNVGCGIGVGSAYVARTHGCHVVGLDISERMIAWSRLRAREERAEDKVEFQVASVLHLPFDKDQFDVVFCESVIAFVDDKARAIQECVRVTKPGGYVGLNESFWIKAPSPEVVARARALAGADIPIAATWQTLWEESGLQDRMITLRQVDPRTEVRSRIRWVGWRWAVRAVGRLLRLYITYPAARQSLKDIFDMPLDVMQQMGYGLFTGRKGK